MPGLLIQLLAILGGVVLATAGIWLYFYAVTALGFGIGGGIGWILSKRGYWLDGGLPSELFAVLIGGVIGIVLVWAYIKFVVMAPGFIVGGVGTYLVAVSHLSGELIVWVTLAGGAVGALVAWLLFEVMVAVTTAFAGAALVRLAIRAGGVVENLEAVVSAQGSDGSLITMPWFATDALFLVVFLGGMAVQLGGRYLGISVREYLPSIGSGTEGA